MKTKEELTSLKKEIETLNKQIAELTEEELKEVTGGMVVYDPTTEEYIIYDNETGKRLGHNEKKIF